MHPAGAVVAYAHDLVKAIGYHVSLWGKCKLSFGFIAALPWYTTRSGNLAQVEHPDSL